jgi:hypothetical protein
MEALQGDSSRGNKNLYTHDTNVDDLHYVWGREFNRRDLFFRASKPYESQGWKMEGPSSNTTNLLQHCKISVGQTLWHSGWQIEKKKRDQENTQPPLE